MEYLMDVDPMYENILLLKEKLRIFFNFATALYQLIYQTQTLQVVLHYPHWNAISYRAESVELQLQLHQ